MSLYQLLTKGTNEFSTMILARTDAFHSISINFGIMIIYKTLLFFLTAFFFTVIAFLDVKDNTFGFKIKKKVTA